MFESLCIWALFLGNARSVGLRDEVCNNPSVLSVFLWVDEEDRVIFEFNERCRYLSNFTCNEETRIKANVGGLDRI